MKHQKAPCAAPPGGTLCFKVVDPEDVAQFGTDVDCPDCTKALAALKKNTTRRGILKKGYGNRA